MAKLAAFVSVVAILIAWCYSFYNGVQIKNSVHFKSLEYHLLGGRYNLYDENQNTLLEWREDTTLKSRSLLPCDTKTIYDSHCFVKSETVQLEIKQDFQREAECHNIKYTALSAIVSPTVCFDLADAYWYGGAEAYHQHWPMNAQQMPMQPFVSNDVLSHQSEFKWGSIVERYWLSSLGVGIIVNNDVPLHVSFNQNGSNEMCFKAEYSTLPFNTSKQFPFLDFTVCRCYGDEEHSKVKRIHQFMYPKQLNLPSGVPDRRMMKYPVWSTWARYKVFVNETKTLEYAKEIIEHGFPNSQIEIDDMFTTAYGDIDFDLKKFPNPKNMTDTLHKMGFRVTVWVHPFANIDSKAFVEGVRGGYWVMDEGGLAPALIRWWQGIGAILDVTNEAAVTWYTDRLKAFQKSTGVHSFKFDAGEIMYLPSHFHTIEPLNDPNEFTTKYVNAVAKLGTQIEVRAGHQSQVHPIFVRMFDKESRWGYNNGLKTMIPTALTMSILGYHFILPDMIGGNAYVEGNFSDTILPNRELFIRWVQLSAYLPSMQFSIAPWQYDEEVTKISQDMVKIHENVVTPILERAAEESLKMGTPLIRPLWWHSTDVVDALTCDSQFFVGDNLMVAPILDEGARSRDIYIPRGTWYDELRRERLYGPQHLRNYKIQLTEIATFKKE